MFDPTVGRFLEDDPIEFEGGDANVVRYVGNAVTKATDPMGLSEVSDFLDNAGESVARIVVVIPLDDAGRMTGSPFEGEIERDLKSFFDYLNTPNSNPPEYNGAKGVQGQKAVNAIIDVFKRLGLNYGSKNWRNIAEGMKDAAKEQFRRPSNENPITPPAPRNGIHKFFDGLAEGTRTTAREFGKGTNRVLYATGVGQALDYMKKGVSGVICLIVDGIGVAVKPGAEFAKAAVENAVVIIKFVGFKITKIDGKVAAEASFEIVLNSNGK